MYICFFLWDEVAGYTGHYGTVVDELDILMIQPYGSQIIPQSHFLRSYGWIHGAIGMIPPSCEGVAEGLSGDQQVALLGRGSLW